MIRQAPAYDPEAPILVVDVGNTRIGIARFQSGILHAPLSVPTSDFDKFSKAFDEHIRSIGTHRPAAVVLASVVPTALENVREIAEKRLSKEPLVVGGKVPLPLEVAVDDKGAIGVDRVCAAAAAYDRIQTECTIIDFGTAVTVDLLDNDGVLLGGAILPGLRMQLRALHEHTAQLPHVEPGFPKTPFGRNTTEAMQTGVCRGLIGAIRGIVEGYATKLNHWPQVVATGGDLEFIAPHCDFLDTIVNHLTLRGIAIAYQKYMTESETDA